MKIINFKKKKINLLTIEQQKSYKNAKICYFVNKNVTINIEKIESIVKLEINVII